MARRGAGFAGVGVRRALSEDVEAIVAMLVRAFAEDPIVAHLFPAATPRTLRVRARGVAAFFRSQVRDLVNFGGVFTTDDHAGAAAWAPPGKPFPKGAAGLASVLSVVPWVLAAATPRRALRFLAVAERVHAHEPHWYLAILGTEPACQSQGIGTALLAPVLERCDRDGIPARLESSNPRNLPFYARQGFEVVDEVSLGAPEPLLTVMRRQPRARWRDEGRRASP